MPNQTYSYSISADFPISGRVDAAALHAEIQESPIVTALDGVSTKGDVCNVVFKAPLSAQDKTLLDNDSSAPAGGIIGAHTGDPLLLEPRLDEDNRTEVSLHIESKTRGRYYEFGDAFVPDPGDGTNFTTTTRWYKFDFIVDMLEGNIYGGGDRSEDICGFFGPAIDLRQVINPSAPPNILAAPVVAGDKALSILPAYLAIFTDNSILDVSYELSITDGVNSEGPFVIIDYDSSTGEVTLGDALRVWTGDPSDEPPAWTGLANSYASDSGTVITVRRVFIRDVTLDGAMEFGRAAQASAPMPAGTLLCLQYKTKKLAPARLLLTLTMLTGKKKL